MKKESDNIQLLYRWHVMAHFAYGGCIDILQTQMLKHKAEGDSQIPFWIVIVMFSD